jgi:hypothetical protein
VVEQGAVVHVVTPQRKTFHANWSLAIKMLGFWGHATSPEGSQGVRLRWTPIVRQPEPLLKV